MSGLEGISIGETRLSRVDGEAGRLTIAGYAVEDIAPRLVFEQTMFLLWNDRLPTDAELEALRRELAGQRELPAGVLGALREAAEIGAEPMAALRLAIAGLGLEDPSRERIAAVLPTAAATYARLRQGRSPCTPDPELDHAQSFLHLLRGERPTPAEARALHTYLTTVVDHGMNASTFTARVVASTGSTLAAAVEAALGALAGPLHGGAPGPALEALLDLRARGGSLEALTRAWVAEQLRAGERIMGFGHRVYRVRDPRADVLGAAAERLLEGTGLYGDARVHERAVLETLAQLKPGRPIATNVEFYTALLLHGLGLEPSTFTPTFAVARVVGWIAHVAEQRATGRLIRPRVAYVGAEGRTLSGPG